MGISTFTAWFWAFVISTFYLPFQKAVGAEYSFLPFIVVLGASIVGMALFLPETKNRSVDEIVEEFKERTRTVSRTFPVVITKPTTAAPELHSLIEETEDLHSGHSSRYGSFYCPETQI